MEAKKGRREAGRVRDSVSKAIWMSEFPQDVSPPPPPGISLEEAEELRATIEELEGELTDVRAKLGAQEETGRRLSEWRSG